MAHQTTRRLLRELKTVQKQASSYVKVVPQDGNVEVWDFVLKGPQESPFQDGLYWGRMEFKDFPISPPVLRFFTPNGVFRENMAICMRGATHFHKEDWDPQMSIVSLLDSIRFAMQEPPPGGVGIYATTDQARQLYAKDSHRWNRSQEACPDELKGAFGESVHNLTTEEQNQLDEQSKEEKEKEIQVDDDRVNLEHILNTALDDIVNTPTQETYQNLLLVSRQVAHLKVEGNAGAYIHVVASAFNKVKLVLEKQEEKSFTQAYVLFVINMISIFTEKCDRGTRDLLAKTRIIGLLIGSLRILEAQRMVKVGLVFTFDMIASWQSYGIVPSTSREVLQKLASNVLRRHPDIESADIVLKKMKEDEKHKEHHNIVKAILCGNVSDVIEYCKEPLTVFKPRLMQLSLLEIAIRLGEVECAFALIERGSPWFRHTTKPVMDPIVQFPFLHDNETATEIIKLVEKEGSWTDTDKEKRKQLFHSFRKLDYFKAFIPFHNNNITPDISPFLQEEHFLPTRGVTMVPQILTNFANGSGMDHIGILLNLLLECEIRQRQISDKTNIVLELEEEIDISHGVYLLCQGLQRTRAEERVTTQCLARILQYSIQGMPKKDSAREQILDVYKPDLDYIIEITSKFLQLDTQNEQNAYVLPTLQTICRILRSCVQGYPRVLDNYNPFVQHDIPNSLLVILERAESQRLCDEILFFFEVLPQSLLTNVSKPRLNQAALSACLLFPTIVHGHVFANEENLVMVAAKSGSMAILQDLLFTENVADRKKNIRDINTVDASGFSALHHAAALNEVWTTDCLITLVEHGAATMFHPQQNRRIAGAFFNAQFHESQKEFLILRQIGAAKKPLSPVEILTRNEVIDRIRTKQGVPRASQEFCDKLEIVSMENVSQNDVKEDQPQECFHCTGAILNNSEFPQLIRLQPCGHLQHKECVANWLMRNRADCPNCKAVLRNAFPPRPPPPLEAIDPLQLALEALEECINGNNDPGVPLRSLCDLVLSFQDVCDKMIEDKPMMLLIKCLRKFNRCPGVIYNVGYVNFEMMLKMQHSKLLLTSRSWLQNTMTIIFEALNASITWDGPNVLWFSAIDVALDTLIFLINACTPKHSLQQRYLLQQEYVHHDGDLVLTVVKQKLEDTPYDHSLQASIAKNMSICVRAKNYQAGQRSRQDPFLGIVGPISLMFADHLLPVVILILSSRCWWPAKINVFDYRIKGEYVFLLIQLLAILELAGYTFLSSPLESVIEFAFTRTWILTWGLIAAKYIENRQNETVNNLLRIFLVVFVMYVSMFPFVNSLVVTFAFRGFNTFDYLTVYRLSVVVVMILLLLTRDVFLLVALFDVLNIASAAQQQNTKSKEAIAYKRRLAAMNKKKQE
eukprot:m.341800 g.341800  ORF g.341800 m.341800 type:complete len:1369 (-) comp20537_c0_seq1:38-4144(-)